jgi:hypothetical protein
MICMFRQYTCQIFDRPESDLIATKSLGEDRKYLHDAEKHFQERSAELQIDRVQSASAAIEDTNLDTCSKDSGSMPRVSTASNAWPTSRRVGAKEVGR